MPNRLADRIKSEKTLVAVIILAIVSCVLISTERITESIDTDTVGILFSSLAVAAGLDGSGLFGKITQYFTKNLKTTRSAALAILLMTFFTAPFITDISALVIFSALTVNFFKSEPDIMMYVLSLQAAAANIGCMPVPSASAVNLFIFAGYDISYKMYISEVLPIYLFGFVILMVLAFCTKNHPLERTSVPSAAKIESKAYIAIYITLLLLNILVVIGVIDMLTVFISVCLVLVIMDPQIFSKIDYSVLVLLTALYILRGNLLSIREFTDFISGYLNGKIPEANIILSQFTGNLTSTGVLSVFGGNAGEYIFSANTGGLLFIYASYTGVFTKRLCDAELPAEYSGKYYRYYALTGTIFTVFLYVICRVIFSGVYF